MDGATSVLADLKLTMGSLKPPQHACAHCGSPAKSCCKGCKGAPDKNFKDVITIWYCCATCQKRDWPEHKHYCKEAQARSQAKVANDPTHKTIQHHCAHCDRDARLNCNACRGTPSTDLKSTIIVWYCGAQCQKLDWDNHKQHCKAFQLRKAFFRAGSTLKEAWYTFSRIVCTWTIDRIEKRGSTWLLFPPKKYPGDSHLMPFPPACIKTKEEEAAFLNFNACQTAMQCIYGLAKFLLDGYCSEILEVDCYVKNWRVRLTRMYQNGLVDGTDYMHTILKVTLKGGEQYALDLTGAQYGWDEHIMLWDVYEASRIKRIVNTMEFGQSQKEFRAGPSRYGRLISFHDGVLDEFGRAVDLVVKEVDSSPIKGTWLRLPEEEFKAKKDSLLESLRRSLMELKTSGEEQGLFKVSHYGDDYDQVRRSGHDYRTGMMKLPLM